MAKRSPRTSVAVPTTPGQSGNGATRGDASETRERIIGAARSLFRERGYEATAMSQVAKGAGVTTPALYWHFESKAELCGEVLVRDYSVFLAELLKRSVGETPEQRLRAFTTTFVELQLLDEELQRNFGYFQLRDFVTAEAREEIRRLEVEFLNLIKDILRDGQESGAFAIEDPTATAFALTTMCEYVFLWFRPQGRLSPSELGAVYANLAANMVRAGSRR